MREKVWDFTERICKERNLRIKNSFNLWILDTHMFNIKKKLCKKDKILM